jgi:hypothetical protein
MLSTSTVPKVAKDFLDLYYYGRIEQEEIHRLAKEHPSSSHYIELTIVQKFDQVKKWSNPTAVAPQPRPGKYSSTYKFFLIHTIKGWNKKKYVYRPKNTLVPAIT